MASEPPPLAATDITSSASSFTTATTPTGRPANRPFSTRDNTDIRSTATTAVGCGLAGWFACSASDGGGCCPMGFQCGPEVCIAPTPTSSAETAAYTTASACPGYDGFIACASSIGGGCCAGGYTCDSSLPTKCQLTLKVNVKTSTFTTDGTAATSTYLEPEHTAVDRIALDRGENNTGSGRLSRPQIGGIVGGFLGGIALVATLIAWLWIRYKRRQRPEEAEVEVVEEEKKEAIDDTKPPEIGGEEVSRSEMLVEPGEGGLGHELVGGYQAHGISELEGTPWTENWGQLAVTTK
ncbi:hypothetical protein QBC34DRAFT_479865 [Podospora aff. communis PSN243]|uniref:Mid2 domain-containing protein n=1 Tax=Podospora aff. communis PSN243 TaxID=3040156 RepID=A0AAV9FZC4_9PEZI|nr:hypothetical protein QBC34DRAFT_479865 [Podospora aff. communis PSN243]